jgi:hypothetical protein
MFLMIWCYQNLYFNIFCVLTNHTLLSNPIKIYTLRSFFKFDTIFQFFPASTSNDIKNLIKTQHIYLDLFKICILLEYDIVFHIIKYFKLYIYKKDWKIVRIWRLIRTHMYLESACEDFILIILFLKKLYFFNLNFKFFKL